MTMSDRICLMNDGAIEQLGAPDDLYFRPRTLFVADFLGESNLLRGRVDKVSEDGLSVVLADGKVATSATGNGGTFAVGQEVRLLVRPQNLAVKKGEPSDGKLSARLTDIMVTGGMTKLYMEGLGPDVHSLVAAYPTRNLGTRREIGEVLELDWHASDAVAIAVR